MTTNARPLPQRAHEVRALLDGRRTVVRVPVRLPAGVDVDGLGDGRTVVLASGPCESTGTRRIRCPLGGVGDRLRVQEAWGVRVRGVTAARTYRPVAGDADVLIEYRADGHPDDGRLWRSPVTMPQWASRLTLDITDVRVERLGDVTEEDARAEGYLDVPIVVTMNGEPPSCGPGSGWCGGGAVSALSMLAAAWTERYGRRAPWEPSRWTWRVGVRPVA